MSYLDFPRFPRAWSRRDDWQAISLAYCSWTTTWQERWFNPLFYLFISIVLPVAVFLNLTFYKSKGFNNEYFYVGKLSYKMDEVTLKSMFDEFGEIETVNIVKDRLSGRSKGFGFVEMPNNSEADKAVKSLNGKFLDGEHIKVNQATPDGKKSKKSFKRKKFY